MKRNRKQTLQKQGVLLILAITSSAAPSFAEPSVDEMFQQFDKERQSIQTPPQTDIKESASVPQPSPVKPSKKRGEFKKQHREPASFRPAKKASPETPAPSAPVSPNDSAPSQGSKDFGLTGNWGGLRSALDEKGIGLAVISKTEFGRVLSGGAERADSRLQHLDLRLLIDAEKWANWQGVTFFVYGIGDWGANSQKTPSVHVGDIQGTSNIETPVDSFKIYEVWIQKNFGDKISLLLGLHDLNSDFYVTDSSSLFLNASFGVGKELSQTGEGGPSIFPYATGAIRFRLQGPDGVSFQSGIFDARARDLDDDRLSRHAFGSKDGFLLINEIAIQGPEEDPRKYAVGSWTYTKTVDHPSETITLSSGDSAPLPVNNSGAYFLIDQPITKSFSAFIRYGAASVEANEFRDNLAVGTLFRGPFSTRADDKIGFAATAVRSTDSTLPREVAYELTYRAEFGHGIAVQPDLQLIENPSFSTSTDRTLIGSARLEMSF